jgi:MerR family transcriptional regulator, light-induced transcriptional regulator
VTEHAPGRRVRDITALEREYLGHLLVADGRATREVIERALADGVPAAVLYLEVIAPAMYEIGRLWETAQISVAQEHLSTQITQAAIASLSLHLRSGPPIGAGRVAVTTSSPGEMHVLGTQMVADFLETQGWEVLNLGADSPAAEVAELARQRGAAVVALSTALPGHLLSVTRTCQLLRQLPEPPYIVAGGRAYGGDAQRALTLGADAFADDPERLLELLARRFAGDARR